MNEITLVNNYNYKAFTIDIIAHIDVKAASMNSFSEVFSNYLLKTKW